jgi:phosphohistidine phosphatase SixA
MLGRGPCKLPVRSGSRLIALGFVCLQPSLFAVSSHIAPAARELKDNAVKQSIRFVASVLFICLGTSISPRAEEVGTWKNLTEPRTHILMRHAEAPGTGDPAGFKRGVCATQRNLSEAGREQARRIGRAIKERGFTVDRILTSQWCRAAETASLLGLGAVEVDPALNSFFDERENSRRQSAEVLRRLTDLDGRSEKAVLVTHQVNITALTNVFPASGEMIVVRVSGSGLEVLDRMIADE